MKLKYKYALANVWWNKNAQDQPLFRNVNLMNDYFENVRTPWGDLSNFVIKDGVETDTYIIVPETMSINEVLNYHYLLVQEIDEETNEPIRILHYFAEISQDSGNQYYCMLERDVIIDYYILGNVRDRKYTMIYRTHLDRFVYEDDKFKFNGANNSPLYISENIDSDTPLCKHSSLINLNFSKTNSPSFYQYSKLEWVYIYFKFPDNHALYHPYFEGGVNNGYTVMCFPYVPNTDESYLQYNNGTYNWKLSDFLYHNKTLIPYIVNMRIDIVSPFGTLENNPNCTLIYKNSYSQTFKITDHGYFQNASYSFYNYNDNHGIAVIVELASIAISNQVNDKLKNILNYEDFPILTKEYITHHRDYKKEPKIYNGIIKSQINLANNKGKEYNLLSILYNIDEDGKYILNESLVAGITRYYHGIVFGELYNEKNFNNLNENSVSIDTSIPFSVDQYETFLAQNKNFYQSAKLNRDYNLTKNLSNSALSLIAGLASGNALSAVSSVASGAFAGGDYAVDYKQQEYKMDNLKNAPTELHNIDGNYLLLDNLTGLAPRFEIWQPLQSNLEKIADYLFFNGYTYNKLGKLSDFDSTRKYFNFVQGDINGLCYHMNEKGYKLLRDKLLNGIRFWHEEPCNINFEQNDNYETWIDNIE